MTLLGFVETVILTVVLC